jgi:hypothetical protein
VVRKKNKNKGKQVEGIKLTKPKPQFVYRPKLQKSSEDQMKLNNQNVQQLKVSNPKRVNSAGASTSKQAELKTSNSFAALGEGLDEFGLPVGKTTGQGTDNLHTSESLLSDSDEDDVDNIYDEKLEMEKVKTEADTPT